MTRIKLLAVAAALLALSACTGADRFGGGAGATGDGALAGSVNDPTSPVYFSQAIGDRVIFPVDEAMLNQDAMTLLDGQSDWLAQNTEFSALIEGHADEQGTSQYNIALGARRASAVQNYLISRGVAPGRLKTISYGKERPIEICSDETCYSRNRRAVTVLTAGAGV